MTPQKWSEPLYPYVLPSKRICVNVTWSCPTFSKPAPVLADIAAELRNQGMTRVLDFGAGKLRNTLFLLKQRAGFNVYAVEYKECFQTTAAQERKREAERHRGFFYLEFPDQFLEKDFTVDAVLLINVANVVPDPDDRRMIVVECTKRLRSGGWFLWMSQYGEPHYKPGVTRRLRAPDNGWFYNLGKKYQTYYREFSIPEIKDYFKNGQYSEPRKLSAPHHRAFLFQKT